MQQLMQQVKNDPQMVQRVMQSPDGQKLMQLLTSSDNGAGLGHAGSGGGARGSALGHAAASAGSGNTAQMVSMLKKVMQTPEGAALLDRLSSQLQR